MVGNHLPQEWELESKKEPEKEQNGKPALKTFASTELSFISNDTHTTALNKPIWHKEISVMMWMRILYEPPHDKTNNVVVRPAKTQVSHAQADLSLHWAQSTQADLSLRWAHTHYVGFVTRRLIFLWWKYKIRGKILVSEHAFLSVIFAGITLISMPSFGSGR